MTVVDLRSDLLSRPTPEMIEAMAAAAREPALFGLREDPRQQALECRLAELLGQEDALLFPTCTMANEVALMLLARPGEVVTAQSGAHITTSEAGAPAALGGVTVETVPGEAVMPPVAAWEALARRAADELKPRVAAFSLENTHNRGGGAPVTAAYTAEVVAVARRYGVGVHLDGARLFNAAVALSAEPAALARGCDTVAVSLNKALGAVAGAALAGSRVLIGRAQVLRQRLGGGIRPTGMIAASGLAALDGWRQRLAEDHARARRLAALLAPLGGISVPVPATNIVVAAIDVGGPAAEALCDRLAAKGVRALPFGPGRVRLTVYHGIDDAAVERAAAAFASCL
ncbi:MAG: aminotransferase class I/II-fold pyridoxal phosphate-dependent enzyme [Alphaproteobacteria bacterium]|nr:aminotransferase class I/II-fold pyridoxal phosphate-dependent enzyme [Alphaproteobacteria bacterium]